MTNLSKLIVSIVLINMLLTFNKKMSDLVMANHKIDIYLQKTENLNKIILNHLIINVQHLLCDFLVSAESWGGEFLCERRGSNPG